MGGSPYIDRHRENGWSLYVLLGIVKGELRICEMFSQAVGMNRFHILVCIALGFKTAMAQVLLVFQGQGAS